jgi:hypothetical protein
LNMFYDTVQCRGGLKAKPPSGVAKNLKALGRGFGQQRGTCCLPLSPTPKGKDLLLNKCV